MKIYSNLFLDSVIELGKSYGLKFSQKKDKDLVHLSDFTNEMILEIQFIGEVTGSFLIIAGESTFRKISAKAIGNEDPDLFDSFLLDFLNISIQPALENLSKSYRYLTITAPRLYHAPVKFPEFPLDVEQVKWQNETIHLYTLLDKRVLDTMQAYLQAKEANESKSRFLANISHDIRTPLNAVLGFSQLLEDRELDEESKSYVQKIRKSSISLLELINDILDLSKIESGKLELNYVAVAVKSVFSEMEYMFSLKANNQDLSFQINISPDFPEHVFLDEARLKQILINLLSNSFKFTEQGFIYLTAAWDKSKRSEMGKAIFSVSDTGRGIPEDQQQKVFSAFEQVKGQDFQKYGGTGLGLAITKKIVELMGGEITVKSQLGKGTQFTVEIPEVKTARLSKTTIELDPGNSHLEFAPAKILVVDDLEINRKLLRAFLDQYNFETIEAEDGYTALDLAGKEKPDLIFLDMKMPEMSGYDVIQALKRQKKTSSIPVVAVTASALKKEREILKQVFDGYLPKPLNRRELLDELKKYLEFKEVNNSEEIKVQVVSKQLVKSLIKGCSDKIEPLIRQLEKDPTSVNAMIELGKSLAGLADKFPEPGFLNWKSEIQDACDNYNIDRVTEMIASYEEMIASLNARQER